MTKNMGTIQARTNVPALKKTPPRIGYRKTVLIFDYINEVRRDFILHGAKSITEVGNEIIIHIDSYLDQANKLGYKRTTMILSSHPSLVRG